MTTRSYLFGLPDVAFVTDNTGVTSLTPGVPITTSIPDQALTAALVTDSDIFYAPSATLTLAAALVIDAETFHVPGIVALSGNAVVAQFLDDADAVYAPTAATGAVSLLPALVVGDDTFAAPSVTSSKTLAAGLVTDTDTFSVPAIGIATILLPALVTDADTISAPSLSASRTLQPARVTDAETFFDPNVVAAGAPRTLLPSRITDAETFYAPTLSFFVRSLLPSKVNDSETVYPAYSIDTAKPPKQQTLRPGRVGDLDTIYAARFPRTPQLFVDLDVIFAPIAIIFYPLTAAFVASDDVFPSPFVAMQAEMALVSDHEAIYRPTFSLLLVPDVVVDEEAIPAADVGWQVIAEFTDDVDVLYDVEVLAFYPLQPEVWLDEETVDTYPFFLQQLTGGIPVPKPIGLTGSLSQRRQLTGSLDTRRRLTGSISPRRELTGSMKNR